MSNNRFRVCAVPLLTYTSDRSNLTRSASSLILVFRGQSFKRLSVPENGAIHVPISILITFRMYSQTVENGPLDLMILIVKMVCSDSSLVQNRLVLVVVNSFWIYIQMEQFKTNS